MGLILRLMYITAIAITDRCISISLGLYRLFGMKRPESSIKLAYLASKLLQTCFFEV